MNRESPSDRFGNQGMCMRTLITGAEGFTGHYMAAELKAAGHEVHALVRQQVAVDCASCVYEAELKDARHLASVIAAIRPQWVVHLAAVSFVPHADTQEIYLTNVVGSRNLLQALALLSVPPQRVLLASSANIYGNAGDLPIDESAPAQPANDYAISKLAMEHVARLFAQLPIVIARPFNYTGVGQSENFLVPKIVSHVRRRAPVIELGNLDIARDFLDVRVLAGYYRRLLESAAAEGATVNLCSGRTWSLRELLQMAREISGHDIAVNANPAFVRADDIITLSGNPKRLHSLVGCLPPIELRDTLRWMIEAP